MTTYTYRGVDRDLLTTDPVTRRGPKPAQHPCGTEQRYQQHHHTGDTAEGLRRVTCQPCLEAHAANYRAGIDGRAKYRLNARNRAMTRLKERHEDEFAELFADELRRGAS